MIERGSDPGPAPPGQPASGESAQARPGLGPLRVLARFLRPYGGTLGLAAGALLVAAAATLTLPVAVRQVIDAGVMSADPAAVDRQFAVLFVVAAFLAVFSAARYYLVSWLGERVVADLRAAVYRRVLDLSPAFFEATRTGEVLSRLTTDTTLVQSIAGVNLSIALRSALTLTGALVMLLVTSPRLTGLVLVLVPAVLVPLLVYGRRVRRLSRDSQDRVADSSAVAGETLDGIATVQALNLEEHQAGRFSDAVTQAFETAVRRIRARAVLTAFAILVVFGAVVFVLWVGTHDVFEGRMTPGELGQFLLYAVLVAGSAAGLSEVWGEMQRAAGALERLVELLEATPQIRPPADPAPLPDPLAGHLRLAGVHFHYPTRPEPPALDGLDLEVRPGETVALVGPSGSGKSTVVRLLLRFYDPQAGRITLDGVDLARLDPRELRRVIGLVPQEPVIFAESALENIRYGRPEASDAEVRAAARDAGAAEFLERLPEGYDTSLGERGARLSGGQRQRIAIARAILRNPPLLLLDEATSSLDAQSEELVQASLARLARGRTTLVIAHRLATVRAADRIVVLDGGRVVATGSHAELVKGGGLYARLATLQLLDGGDEAPAPRRLADA